MNDEDLTEEELDCEFIIKGIDEIAAKYNFFPDGLGLGTTHLYNDLFSKSCHYIPKAEGMIFVVEMPRIFVSVQPKQFNIDFGIKRQQNMPLLEKTTVNMHDTTCFDQIEEWFKKAQKVVSAFSMKMPSVPGVGGIFMPPGGRGIL
jgi:hypothetical protein